MAWQVNWSRGEDGGKYGRLQSIDCNGNCNDLTGLQCAHLQPGPPPGCPRREPSPAAQRLPRCSRRRSWPPQSLRAPAGSPRPGSQPTRRPPRWRYQPMQRRRRDPPLGRRWPLRRLQRWWVRLPETAGPHSWQPAGGSTYKRLVVPSHTPVKDEGKHNGRHASTKAPTPCGQQTRHGIGTHSPHVARIAKPPCIMVAP